MIPDYHWCDFDANFVDCKDMNLYYFFYGLVPAFHFSYADQPLKWASI